MRFMVMHKADAAMESGHPPDRAIVQGMGKLIGESTKSGVFLDGDGLHRSAQRVRLRFSGGQCAVTRGPLQGDNELLAAFAEIRAKSMDDAIEQAHRFARAAGALEIEIGPVVEPWDLGFAKRPPGLEGGRFLLLRKADARSEAGEEPAPEVAAATAKLTAELSRSGALLKSGSLTPSAQGARLRAGTPGRRRWIDGPFAESKELIAGFSILAVASKQEALAWADRYAAILGGDAEVDVRVVGEAAGFAG